MYIFICKPTISKEFAKTLGCCISKEWWGWRQGLRPTLDRRGWRDCICPTLARAGWRGNPRPTLSRGGWRGSPRPMLSSGGWRGWPRPTLASLRASGEFSPGRKSARRWPHPLKSYGSRHSQHCRASRINDFEGFPKHRAISGPRRKSARRSQACGHRAEICPGGNPPDAPSTQE